MFEHHLADTTRSRQNIDASVAQARGAPVFTTVTVTVDPAKWGELCTVDSYRELLCYVPPPFDAAFPSESPPKGKGSTSPGGSDNMGRRK